VVRVPRTGRPLDRARGIGYESRFRGPEGDVIEILWVGDTLRATTASQEPTPLFWQEGDRFEAEIGWRSTLRFVRDDRGLVDALDLSDVGPLRYDRVPENDAEDGAADETDTDDGGS